MRTHKSKTKSVKQKSLHRIKIIQGHLQAIEKMLKEDQYCVDIIHQSMAVQSALQKLDAYILEDHLKTCVIHQIKSGEEQRMVRELKRLFEMK